METFCYVLDQKHWVVGGATSNGAGIFDWAGHTFLQEVVQSAKEKGENPYDALLSAIAFVPAGANGLIFHPYLLGEQSTALGRRCVWQFYRFTAATYRKRNDEGDSRRDLSQPLSDFKRSLPGKSAHRDPCYRRVCSISDFSSDDG